MGENHFIGQDDQKTEQPTDYAMSVKLTNQGGTVRVELNGGFIVDVHVEVYDEKVHLIVYDKYQESEGVGPQIQTYLWPVKSVTIYLCSITTEYGTSTEKFATEDERFDYIVNYARGWWVEDGPGVMGREQPKDPETLLEEYFDFADESYTFSEIK